MKVNVYARTITSKKRDRSPWPLVVSIVMGVTLANAVTGNLGIETILAAVLAGFAFAAAAFALLDDSPDMDERVKLNRMRAADALLRAVIGVIATMGGYMVGTKTGTLLLAAATGLLAIWGALILYFNWRDTQ